MMSNSLNIGVGISVTSIIALLLSLSNPSLVIRDTILMSISLVIILLLISAYLRSFKKFWNTLGKLLLFLLFGTLVQITVFTLGGIKSPFFILFHLFLIGASFMFNPIISYSFFGSSTIALVLLTLLQNEIQQEFINDPITFIFLLFSYIAVIPLVHILAASYHGKERLSQALTQQLTLDETLLQEVKEMLLVTDATGNIISVNGAVEMMLNKPSVELVGKPLFSVIFLKNAKGEILTDKSLDLATAVNEKKVIGITDLLFMPLNGLPSRTVQLKVSPVIDLEGNVEQLSFFITSLQKKEGELESSLQLEQAKLMKDARIEDLLQRLHKDEYQDLRTRFILVTHAQEDITLSQEIADHGILRQIVHFDVYIATQEIMKKEIPFARMFKTPVEFIFANFGNEDILPLLPKDGKTAVLPEHFTGPFFTVRGDAKLITIVIQKLLQLSLIISSKTGKYPIKIVLERGNREQVYLHFHVASQHVTPVEISHLFEPYYPNVAEKTNLYLGSGLEGYLAKTIATHLDLPLTCVYHDQTGELVFTLRFTRDEHTLT